MFAWRTSRLQEFFLPLWGRRVSSLLRVEAMHNYLLLQSDYGDSRGNTRVQAGRLRRPQIVRDVFVSLAGAYAPAKDTKHLEKDELRRSRSVYGCIALTDGETHQVDVH